MKKRLVKRLTKHRVYTILKLRKGTKIMMGSLKDVAKLAGVSVSTVSYVINGKKNGTSGNIQEDNGCHKRSRLPSEYSGTQFKDK